MLSQIYSAGLAGVDGYQVTVECSAWDRLPRFELVGLPDMAVKEAKERVRCACENSGLRFPAMDIMVNLAPASTKKEGSAYDLAIVCSLLQCDGAIPYTMDMSSYCLIGELALSGELRPVKGVLPLALSARASGRKYLIVPMENADEAAAVAGITVYGAPTLSAVVKHLRGETVLQPRSYDRSRFDTMSVTCAVDMSDVRGQELPKRAMEVAAAGGHHMLMIGPPGSGKSMLAKRLGTILPPFTFEESLEASKIHSVVGSLGADLLTSRPFRSPHHTTSPVGMVGGGADARPGEISLAHGGVLFLDEFPEFPKQVTEALRQPLEDGHVTVTRAKAKYTYPAALMLVCAMNPCKCGHFGDPTVKCTCSFPEVQKYLSRVSGPLLDRIDIQVEVPAVTYDQLSGRALPGESSAAIRQRVMETREFAAARFVRHGDDCRVNAHMTPAELRRHCTMTDRAEAALSRAFTDMGMSARGHDRILRVARTIADMAGSDIIDLPHIAEAIRYRSLDRKYWKK